MSKATNKIDDIFKKLSSTVKESINKVTMLKLGEYATTLIVKRTRLGYAVGNNFGPRGKFFKLSEKYVVARQGFDGLSSLTSPRRSNLTRTGQMLDSMKAKHVKGGTIQITPTGKRKKQGNEKKTPTNLEVAQYAHSGSNNRPPRPFNRVSAAEFDQLLRFYRKTFGDLVKKSFKGSLIRK